MFVGDVLEGFDFRQVTVRDKEWTKTLGIVDDDGNLIWLCEVPCPSPHDAPMCSLCLATGRVRTIYKQGGNWHRNQRGQLLCDELKPFFDLPKIGCSMVQDLGGRWGVLMRFHGDGRNLTDIPQRTWLASDLARGQMVRTAIYDLVIGNNNRLKRNYLWCGAAGVLPIDEEKGLDFDGLVTFRMDQAVREMLFREIKAMDLPGFCARIRTELTVDRLEAIARQMFWPQHARLLAAALHARTQDLEADVWRFLGSRYRDGKALGVGSKRARGPQIWDGY